MIQLTEQELHILIIDIANKFYSQSNYLCTYPADILNKQKFNALLKSFVRLKQLAKELQEVKNNEQS